MAQLLSGLRVLDVGSFVAGPAAATVMGDFGADVIKVEPPEGDAYRTLLQGSAIDYFWLLDSRNKRSLVLDLKRSEGRAVLMRLVADADVFVTNYRQSLLDRLELGYESLSRHNPRLVYAHVSGYGHEGPEAERTAFDTTAWWGRSGLQDYIRGRDEPVQTSSPGMGDHATAMSLFGAIMSALYRRERTGRGGHVSTSLVANGAWSHGMVLQAMFAGVDWSAMRQRGEMPVAPLAQAYRTRDDRWVHLTVLNPAKEWGGLARALGHPEWIEDVRFATAADRRANGAELATVIAQAFAELTLAAAKVRLDAAGITYGFAAAASEIAEDRQLRASNVVVETGDVAPEYRLTVSSPIHLSGETKVRPVRAPAIGQHTREILAEMGYTDGEIESLIASKAAGTRA